MREIAIDIPVIKTFLFNISLVIFYFFAYGNYNIGVAAIGLKIEIL